jgi:hypothetical protein
MRMKFFARAAGAWLAVFACAAAARDSGQWANEDPAVAAWFARLMQPDNPAVPCCGTADAYWADEVETDADGRLVAVITDERPDEPLRRPHVPVGTRIVVPQQKIKFDRGNPTGHIVIFLNAALDVLCYVQNGGV